MVNKVDVFVHYQNHLRYFPLHILHQVLIAHFFKGRPNFEMRGEQFQYNFALTGWLAHIFMGQCTVYLKG